MPFCGDLQTGNNVTVTVTGTDATFDFSTDENTLLQ